MDARSYLENVANRASAEAAWTAMVRGAVAICLVGAGLLAVLSGFHPAATIIAAVLVVGGALLLREAMRLSRQRRREPLDFTFDPAPTGGLLAPAVALGVPAGVGLFFAIFGAVLWFADPAQALLVGGAGLGVAVALALVALPTLFIERQKWSVLRGVLASRPDQVEQLQDIRARFPSDAPFPFAAPTDEVTLP